MICPHCKKIIQYKVSKAAVDKAMILRNEGYSLRDIERILLEQGIRVSYSTLSREFKKQELVGGWSLGNLNKKEK